MLPNPEILLGYKINSVSTRRNEDILGIYPPIWYSDIKTDTLSKNLSEIIEAETICRVLSCYYQLVMHGQNCEGTTKAKFTQTRENVKIPRKEYSCLQ